jgi:hypothetical protein
VIIKYERSSAAACSRVSEDVKEKHEFKGLKFRKIIKYEI